MGLLCGLGLEGVRVEGLLFLRFYFSSCWRGTDAYIPYKRL